MPTENFEGVTSAELLTDGPPSWVRDMSTQYVRTGTVKPADAALLLGTKPESADLTSGSPTLSSSGTSENK